jgi:hypothetical protein
MKLQFDVIYGGWLTTDSGIVKSAEQKSNK